MSEQTVQREAMTLPEELTAAAAMVRAEMAEDAEFLGDEGYKASEALAVLLEKTAKNFGRVPAGVVFATRDLARALVALMADDGDDE